MEKDPYYEQVAAGTYVDAIEAKAVEQAEQSTDLASMLSDMQERLERLEAHFTTQGLNELASVFERRLVSRMRYGRNPQIERGK